MKNSNLPDDGSVYIDTNRKEMAYIIYYDDWLLNPAKYNLVKVDFSTPRIIDFDFHGIGNSYSGTPQVYAQGNDGIVYTFMGEDINKFIMSCAFGKTTLKVSYKRTYHGNHGYRYILVIC